MRVTFERRSTLLALSAAGLLLLAATGCDKKEGLRITNIEPKTGPATGGSSVTIIGSGFEEGGAKGVKVYFGNRTARVMMFQGDDKLIVEPPPGKEGETVDVEIIFDDARRHVYKDAYTYANLAEGFGVDELTEGEEEGASSP